jgi:hypothetical protein
MNKLEKLQMAWDLGYRYDETSGDVTGPNGKILTWYCKTKPNNAYKKIHMNQSKGQQRQFVSHHHFGWWCVYGEVIEGYLLDHINGDKQDNSIKNLRKVTLAQNQWNLHREVKGWSYKSGAYYARIRVNNKNIYLGRYDTPEKAHQVYLDAKQKYHQV